ncbi:Uncharacterised protein [uncultured archaeon]|nr:Uncharacterised protein [uncultured archaeon]
MEVKNAICLALACTLALLAVSQANDTYIPSTTGGDNYTTSTEVQASRRA